MTFIGHGRAMGGARNFKWSNGHLKPMTVEQFEPPSC